MSRCRGVLLTLTLKESVTYSFRRANPHIPDDPLFHTFVLNEQDSVVLVGDPFKNEKMEKLLLKVIEKEKQRRKKDKNIRA
jgi:hypothetical protein